MATEYIDIYTHIYIYIYISIFPWSFGQLMCLFLVPNCETWPFHSADLGVFGYSLAILDVYLFQVAKQRPTMTTTKSQILALVSVPMHTGKPLL